MLCITIFILDVTIQFVKQEPAFFHQLGRLIEQCFVDEDVIEDVLRLVAVPLVRLGVKVVLRRRATDGRRRAALAPFARSVSWLLAHLIVAGHVIFDVLPQRARVRVPFGAAWHLTRVRFLRELNSLF